MELARNLRFLSRDLPVGSRILVTAAVPPLEREGTGDNSGGDERATIGATVPSPEDVPWEELDVGDRPSSSSNRRREDEGDGVKERGEVGAAVMIALWDGDGSCSAVPAGRCVVVSDGAREGNGGRRERRRRSYDNKDGNPRGV